MKKLCAMLLFAHIFVINTAKAQDFDHRDPLSIVDEVTFPHFVSVVLPVASVAAALLLSKNEDSDQSAKENFEAGKGFMQIQTGYYQSYHEHVTDVFEGSFGIGKYVRDWLAIGIDVHATRLSDHRVSTWAFGGRPFVRWRFLRAKRFSFHFEQGLGMVFSAVQFPPGGTKANFNPTYSLSIAYHIQPGLQLAINVRHYHISNGGVIAGADRNPGFDSNGVSIGMRFFD